MRPQNFLAAVKMTTYLYIIALSVNKPINNIIILESSQDVIILKMFIMRAVVFSHQTSCY